MTLKRAQSHARQAVEKKFPEKFFYAGWMGPERYALLAGCDFTLLPSRHDMGVPIHLVRLRMAAPRVEFSWAKR